MSYATGCAMRSRGQQPSGIHGLLTAGLLLIEDACPPDQEAYLCRIEDADDGTACRRCWQRYLFALANGQRFEKGRAV